MNFLSKKLKKKIISDIIFSYRQKIINLKKYRRFIPRFYAICLLSVVIFLSIAIYYFFVKADTINFYPSSCLGGWQNPQNAQGTPEFLSDPDFKEFNEKNSAIYDGEKLSQIFCGNFQGEKQNGDLKKVNLKFSWKIIPKTTLEPSPIQLPASSLEINASQILNIDAQEPVNFILPATVPENSEAANSQDNSTISPIEPATNPVKVEIENLKENKIKSPEKDSRPSSFLINFALATDLESDISPAPTEDSSTSTPPLIDILTSASPSIENLLLKSDDLNRENNSNGNKTASSSILENSIKNSISQNEILENFEDFLEITYSLDGIEWKSIAKINKENRANLSSELSLKSWAELENLQIRLQILPTVDEAPLIYLDGIWLETEYENSILRSILPEKEIALENLPKVEIEESRVFKGTKETFSPSEDPIFEISPILEGAPPATSSPSSFWQNFFQKISFFEKASAKEIRVYKTQVFDIDGQKVNFEPIPEYHNGKIFVRIPKIYSLKPGRYTLKIELTDGQKVFLSSKEFEWGVLAINFNKSIYRPNETIKAGLAVLNKNGHTICDARIDVSIFSPASENTKFSTADGSIEKSLECGPNTVTNKPDYYFISQAKEIGTYKIEIQAQTSEGVKNITDSFEVKQKVPFSIERKGPIRIWPLANYQMEFVIKTYEIYQGTVREIIPSLFEILSVKGDYAYYKIKPGTFSTKFIDLEVDFEANQTYKISYEFDAPDISPEFYLLGPFQFVGFKEIRQWQIASDAVSNGATIVYGNSINDGNLNFRNYTAPSTLGSELTTTNTSASDIAFVKIATAPTREEKIAVHQKIDSRMDILTCASGCDNSADWTLRATLPTLITTIDGMPTKRRPFDIAYEQLSGRAIIVFSEASTIGKAYYCIWDGISWSPSPACGATITPGPTNEIPLTISNKIGWIRLAPRGEKLTPYRNNELLFGAADQDYKLHLGRWTGANWVDGANPTNALTSLDGQIFNLAWEEVSGRGIAIWDATTSATNLQFSIYTSANGWTAAQTGPTKASTGVWKWIEIASNPKGNEIAVITGNNLSDAETFIWNNSTWSKGPNDLTAESIVGKHIDTKWTRFNNRALFLWTDSNALTSDMTCWTSAGFSAITADIGKPNINNTDDVEDIFLTASPNNNEMLMTRHDIVDDLKLLRYSDASGCADSDWTAIGGALNGAVEGIAGNTVRLAHGIAYTPYSPWSQNWRWTSDMTNLTPAAWLAMENTTPTEIASGQNLRLRINIAETNNQGQTDTRKKLQYSTSSIETENWYDVDAQAGNGIWRYCDGPGIDDSLMPTAVLTGSNAVGPFIENGATASAYDHTALSTAEWDFCVQNNGAEQATTYYFRPWDNGQQSPVFKQQTPGTSYTYSSLTTAGVTITVTLDSNVANFGNFAPGTPIATSTIIIVETANSSGFLIKANRDDNETTLDLDIDALVNIPDRTVWNSGSNNATVWLSTDKHLGFRVNQGGTETNNYNSTWWGSDDTDSNAKYAGFPTASTLDTIVSRPTASSPPTNTKVKYKVNTENYQKTGNYSGGITYTITVNP